MRIAIPQQYPEGAPGGEETKRLRVARFIGSPNFQPKTRPKSPYNLIPPVAASQLCPLTQRPHFRANGLYHEVRWPPNNPSVEARAPCADFLHACFRANLNFKGARKKEKEKALKESKERAKYSYKLFMHILSTCLILLPAVPISNQAPPPHRSPQSHCYVNNIM